VLGRFVPGSQADGHDVLARLGELGAASAGISEAGVGGPELDEAALTAGGMHNYTLRAEVLDLDGVIGVYLAAEFEVGGRS
jgi:hypothetical protein